jgi:signal transduction histidine kinase
MLDDFGLTTALKRYLEDWSARSGISIQFQNTAAEPRRLPARIETACYRIAQEALTNVAKHAAAGRVSVVLDCRSDWISLIVEDDGQGFAAGQSCGTPTVNEKMGLVGMEERVTAAGGNLQV